MDSGLFYPIALAVVIGLVLDTFRARRSLTEDEDEDEHEHDGRGAR